MRALEPEVTGYADSAGVRVHFEVFGSGSPTLLLLPTWAIVHSRAWKLQIPYLARHYRVVTFDPRGNGLTDRPGQVEAYSDHCYVEDAFAVLDAADTSAAVLVAHCTGVVWALQAAVAHSERVLGLVAISSVLDLAPGLPERGGGFDDPLPADPQGWQQKNRRFWLDRWPDYVRFFCDRMTNDSHSTKIYDDAVEWGLETDGPTMVRIEDAESFGRGGPDPEGLCRGLPCPVMVINGDADRFVSPERSRRLAELSRADHLELQGAGHLPHLRHPVVVNHAIRAFVDRIHARAPARTPWLFARQRPRRVLWISSAIGLGHVYRDLAIARALRERVPDLEIQWWVQPPVTDVLRGAGEIVHPASADLASESAHWESESTRHGLHAFQAFRRMDEILCANFMLFDDLVRETDFDLWIGDESWEIDHFLHENPDCKRAPFVFLTDVVGFLPVQDDERERALTADYNAEMIEHRERYPYLRDASLFIGAPAELPDESFGPGLPRIREWTSKWFDTVPYVVPYDATAYRDPERLRRNLGYGTGYPLLAAAVGGTAVGRPLLTLVAEAFEVLRRREPAARMVMVTGPRIDPEQLPEVAGLVKRGYLDGAFAHLAAADVAVVQGGLSTTMELVAARRPFVYFPLAQHWEQQHFVGHRLDHYRAGTRMAYAETGPEALAEALLRTMGTAPAYRPVPTDGAVRAAERIAAVLLGPGAQRTAAHNPRSPSASQPVARPDAPSP